MGTATPTTPSQVGGNRDRTAPPQARQTEQGTGAGHAEGHGPRGTALPAPSAGTARGAHAIPPRRGGSGRRGSASAHTRKGHAGTTRRATGPSARNAQTAWNGVPGGEGKRHPDRTARHTQRGTRGAGRGNERDTTPGTGPNPPHRPRAPRTHRRGTAPAKAVVAHSATVSAASPICSDFQTFCPDWLHFGHFLCFGGIAASQLSHRIFPIYF